MLRQTLPKSLVVQQTCQTITKSFDVRFSTLVIATSFSSYNLDTSLAPSTA